MAIHIRHLIRDRMDALGWSEGELARRSGVSQPAISNFLAGKKDMRGQTIDKLLNAMGWQGFDGSDDDPGVYEAGV